MTNLLFTLMLCFCSLAQSQKILRTVVSGSSNTAIPFVRVGVEGANTGVITNEKGYFSLDVSGVSASRNLIIQAAGYEEFREPIQTLLSNVSEVIILKEKVAKIQEVKIQSSGYKIKTWGSTTHTKSVQIGIGNSTVKDDSYREMAIEFNNKKKVKILKINLNIAEFQSKEPLALIFTVYSKKNGLPDQPLYSTNLETFISKEKIINDTFTFDVKDQNLWIDKEDFFISVRFKTNTESHLVFSGALLKTFYNRYFYGNWEKITIAQPALNIEVKILKIAFFVTLAEFF